MGNRKVRIAVSVAGLICGMLLAAAGQGTRSRDGLIFPQGYRQWVHVKSAVVGPQSPFFEKVGGVHHIYANEKAMQGYQTGRFPNGSVLVFDVLETRESTGTVIEGPRRFLDVMEKDSKRFSATGGWGYQEFKGDGQTDPVLTPAAAQECQNCHAAAKDHDSVFSRFRQ